MKSAEDYPLYTAEQLERAFCDMMEAAAEELRVIANRLYEIEKTEGLTSEGKDLLDSVEENISRLTAMEQR